MGAPERTRRILAGRVHTFEPGTGTLAPAEILVRNGRIAAVGEPGSIANAGGAGVLDLGDATLTPGLIDSHIHLTEWALVRQAADLSRADRPEAVVAAVEAHAGADAGWVRGRGWNAHNWGGDYPDRRLLDDRMGDRPVVLQSHDMHALWVNGVVLVRAGIGPETPDPAGGRIVRDGTGRATGVLLDRAAELVTAVLPPVTEAALADAVVSARAALNAWGITGVHALPAIHVVEPDPFALLERLRARGRLMLRVLQHLPVERLDRAIEEGMRSGDGNDFVRTGGAKMFLDGALGSRTAWMREPYEDGPGTGIRVLDPETFRSLVERASRAGIASVVHAIGDAAVDLAFEVLGDPGVRVSALDHRIEHVQCCPQERIAGAGRLGVTCSMQPAHLRTDWPIADRLWGPARAGRTYALRSLLDAGARLAFGSDAPVEPADPRLGLHAAVTRTDGHGRPDGGWFPAERLTIEEAFAGYTRDAAAAAGRDGGTIRPGALADFAAWRTDPLGARDDDITTLECVATIVGGELVHSA